MSHVTHMNESCHTRHKYESVLSHTHTHTGDAVHTVKPYFGLGANSALEDVVQFSACLDQQADVGSILYIIYDTRVNILHTHTYKYMYIY